MKKFGYILLTIVVIAVFTLSACANKQAEQVAGPIAETTYPMDKPEIAVQAVDQEIIYPVGEGDESGSAVDDQTARMEALITEKIGTNHELSFILEQNKTREQWDETLDRMISNGAEITAEEKQLIIDWLISRIQ